MGMGGKVRSRIDGCKGERKEKVGVKSEQCESSVALKKKRQAHTSCVRKGAGLVHQRDCTTAS